MIKIRILAENRKSEKPLIAEHGLSMLVYVDDYKLLFDAGNSNSLLYNAKSLGIDLSAVDAVVLSHGHYDHTGGIPEFCNENKKAKIYVNKNAFCERYEKEDGKPQGENIGIAWCKKDYENRIILTNKVYNICENIIVSGEVEVKDSKNTPPVYFMKKNKLGEFEDDLVKDEQFLIIKGKQGSYVFIGCSHPGVLNCLSYAKSLVGDCEIEAIIGGMHLGSYSDKKVNEIAVGIEKLQVKRVMPLHCTGNDASEYLNNYFGESCSIYCVGDEIVLEK